MGTGENLSASARVQRLQRALHAKAKETPSLRFYSLSDKVWRADVLAVAWRMVRRNGGAAGVDGETVADIEAFGVDRWLGVLARDLKAGTYRPQAVSAGSHPEETTRQVPPVGYTVSAGSGGADGGHVGAVAGLRGRPPLPRGQALQPEQYAPAGPDMPTGRGRSAHDAVRRVHRLLNTDYREVVDADLSDCFGQIPHAELMRSIARRVSDGRVLGWIKAWLEMAVEEDDGHGGRRRGTPQGSPASPVLSNIYMRRFIVGWKVLGYARRFKAEIVNYADDLTVLGKAPATEMLTAVEALMKRLKLTVNTEKTHCCRVPEDSIEFLGYRIGRNYCRETGRAYIGTRPSAASVQSICRRVSELTTRRDGLLSSGVIVARLNRLLDGWANSFTLGQVRPAYAAIDRHAARRLRRWLRRKHKVRSRGFVRFSDARLRQAYGFTLLQSRTTSFPWAKA